MQCCHEQCSLSLPPPRRYWASAEAGYLDLATYYSVPMVSLKACCYHLMKAGVKGFRVDSLRRDW